MIIRRLQAGNILKFTRLDLSFPHTGTILISGDNESGKSAIIETISLALFGRSANLDRDQIQKAIHWGHPSGWVSLDFVASDGRNLSVYRQFSRRDPPQARLNAEGVDKALENGLDAVNAAVVRAVGMEFHHFIETIYLSQRAPEGENPEGIVRMVAGVEDLAVVSSQFESEIKSGREEIGRIAAETTRTEEELAAIGLKPGLLEEKQQKFDELTDNRSNLEKDVSQRTQQINSLGSGYKGATSIFSATIQQGRQASYSLWNQNLKNLQNALVGLSASNLGEAAAIVAKLREKTQRTLESLNAFNSIVDKSIQDGKSRSHWLSGSDAQSLAGERNSLAEAVTVASGRSRTGLVLFLLFLFLAVVVGGTGFVLTFEPQDPRFALVGKIVSGLAGNLEPLHLQGAMGLGVLFLIISLLGLGKIIKNSALKSQYGQARSMLESRAQEEEKRVATISETSQLPLCQHIARLVSLGDQVPWSEHLQQWQQSQGRNLVDDAALGNLLNEWNSDFGRLKLVLEGMLQQLDNDQRQDNERIHSLTGVLTDLKQEIQNERQRKERSQALKERLQSLKEQKTRISHGIDVRSMGRQLIQVASKEIALGFSIELRRLIARTAPLFTLGRYQHLRIDENLDLFAFSTVKHDFVDLSETSRGLRRQLMLALRLALAQALTARSQAQSQMLILDEPFAHFDRDRFRESYQALNGLGGAIRQIFVANQSFDAEMAGNAALHLHCDMDKDVLESTVS
ncbi:MAG: AAA family ATPase [Magnetococcales bacterium]|nr:AAA family ATPase [Magnetococcales bacterium]